MLALQPGDTPLKVLHNGTKLARSPEFPGQLTEAAIKLCKLTFDPLPFCGKQPFK